jgi:hypothetical protein
MKYVDAVATANQASAILSDGTPLKGEWEKISDTNQWLRELRD